MKGTKPTRSGATSSSEPQSEGCWSRSRYVLCVLVSVATLAVGTTVGSQLQGGGLSAVLALGSVTYAAAPPEEGGPPAAAAAVPAAAVVTAPLVTTTLAPAATLAPTTLVPTSTTTARPATTATLPSIFEHWASGSEWLPRIAAVQGDCVLEAEDVPLNPGGGFASKLQLVAAKAMKALKKGQAFRLVGHFAGYTAIKPCEQVLGATVYKKKGSYACFFKPERDCEEGQGKGEASDQEASKAARTRFQSLSKAEEAALYHALEAYLFRLNDDTIEQFRARQTRVGFDENRNLPLAGIHARRGDKVVDAYNRYYTSKEYAQAIFTWAKQASQCSGHDALCTVYVASDSAVVLGEIKGYLEPVSAGTCRFRVIGNDRSVTQTAMDTHQFDHVDEIQGMAGKVQLMKGEEAKEATIDILFDIFMLSRANFFVGTLTSQIGRIAAGLKNAVNYAPAAGSPPVALDYTNWRSVEGMGGGDGIPTPLAEKWVPQPKNDFSLDDASPAAAAALGTGADADAVAAIRAVQADCGRAVEDVDISTPAGAEFAELIRQAAWRATGALRKGKRVSFRGHFGGYSKSNVCKDTVGKDVFDSQGSFACYFLPESPCQADAQRFAAASASASAAAAGAAAAERLRSWAVEPEGAARLLGAVEAWMLRPTEETKAEFMKRDWIARIAEGPSPLIVVQIAGAKAAASSGVASRPAEEYAQAVRAWASSPAAADAPWGKGIARKCVVFVASDGDEALVAMRKLLEGKEAGPCHFTVTGLQGHWAHHHTKDGWPGKLHNQDGRWAALDILFDIDVLARADALLATASSPIARLAAGLRRARRGGEVVASSPALALDFQPQPAAGGGAGEDAPPFEHALWAAAPPQR
mmetsp:Transcript_24880/g.82949  ORF Transcript_24880/g.82949 Transcript_24880/m.82949 type:complete len:868 (-) Transcript_24880:77-2680(-)